jgi:AraC-like DNA-binding protein
MRLSKASDILRSGDSSLKGIAQTTGFCNQFHFSREFKKCYGYSPSVFRKNISGGTVV